MTLNQPVKIYEVPNKTRPFRRQFNTPKSSFPCSGAENAKVERWVGLLHPLGECRINTDYTPLLIYGAFSAVGAYAVQLVKLASIHPIIKIAGAAAFSI